MSLYARLAELPLTVESIRLESLSQQTSAGWERLTTVVVLDGLGQAGVGEDVTYQPDDQLAFRRHAAEMRLATSGSLDAFSRHLDRIELFPQPPVDPAARLYRRWAFESAALDLALRQQGRSLAQVLERPVRPLRFVASLGLGDPPSLEPLQRLRRINPDLAFKIDFDESWTPDLIRSLAALSCIEVVDLKGQYRGAFKGPDADGERYRLVAEMLPDAWIEDPEWNTETEAALHAHLARVTWDAPFHSLADLEQRPVMPRCVNMKPSRFGYLSELCRVYEFCEARGIAMYGGGQFELGPGRGQAQYLAGLFHADASNDLAPSLYNESELPAELPPSPLNLNVAAAGFRADAT